MHFSTISALSLLAAIVPAAVYASPVDYNLTASVVDIEKRAFTNARLTFYDPSVGVSACGVVGSNSAFVVALNAQQFGSGFPGPNCFKDITITANGKTATAQIIDKCPGCPANGLDLSEGLFQFFAPLSVGIITGSWDFV